MARIRSIKPELRTSITVSGWPMEVRYFFVLLWGYLDDYGRGVDDGLLIASDCFPRDRDITPDIVDTWLETMAEDGPVCRYEVDGHPFLHCPNWSEHQKPQHPGLPRVPPCPDCQPDDFDEWRKEHPPRQRRHSRKSREDLMRSSPPVSGTPEGSVEGLQKVCKGSAEPLHGVVLQMPGQISIDDHDADNDAGHDASGESHEDLTSDSGDPQESLTPEQGAGSREQGEGVRKSVAKRQDDVPSRIDVEQACTLLADLIAANGANRPNIGQRWRDDMRRLIDIDGISLEDVLGAIRWSQGHHFWRSNILSPLKLRKHYEAMRLQANPGTAALPPTGTAGTSHNAGVLQRRRARREAQK